MSKPSTETGVAETRCHECDSLLQPDTAYCKMCGATTLPAQPASKKKAFPQLLPPHRADSFRGWWQWVIAGILAIGAFFATITLLSPEPSSPPVAIIPPTITPSVTPTPFLTPTPISQATSTATLPPTITPTPLPSPTLQPPFTITVAPGDTVFGISFRFNVSSESVANQNNLSIDNPVIQQGQTLLVPYPTATPPLEPVRLQVGEEQFIADPTECERYQVQDADTLARIANQYSVPLAALLQVNRLTEDSIMHPGDTVCIPTLSVAVTDLSLEAFWVDLPAVDRSAIRLLYPPKHTIVDAGTTPTLQWVALKDLAPNEWYMVELNRLDTADSYPQRGFTRQTAFQLPTDWLPASSDAPSVNYRWRVFLVTVTGERADGGFNYQYDAKQSGESHFTFAQ